MKLWKPLDQRKSIWFIHQKENTGVLARASSSNSTQHPQTNLMKFRELSTRSRNSSHFPTFLEYLRLFDENRQLDVSTFSRRHRFQKLHRRFSSGFSRTFIYHRRSFTKFLKTFYLTNFEKNTSTNYGISLTTFMYFFEKLYIFLRNRMIWDGIRPDAWFSDFWKFQNTF